MGLGSLYQERFTRCLGLSRLDELLRKSPNINSLSYFSENDRPVVIISDIAFTEFDKLFTELKSRFISSNEYGLDSYLSVRIRHGTLSGQIRSHFETEHLITRKNAKDNSYARNKHWIDSVFANDGDEVVSAADDLLKEFSQRIDDIIDHVNTTLIQIKSSDNPGGLFDYDYSEQEIVKLWAEIFVRDIPIEYEEFLNIIINKLWARTEDNLINVRQFIRNNLKDVLTEALDALALKMDGLHLNSTPTAFSNSLSRCRTNIQNELEAIAEWFRVTEEKTFPNFALDQLVETTLEMVRKCYPSTPFNPITSVESRIFIDGKRFESFVDIMFILLENMAKHSNTQLAAEVHIYHEDPILTIELSNAIPDTTNIAEAKKRVDELRRPEGDGALMKFTRKEGGSGFYKLHKMLRLDLGCKEYDVKFAVEEKSNTFSAIIKMNVKGMMP